MKNKVKYNLKNVHYAPLTFGETGTPSWGKPVPIPGAVSLTLSAEGDVTTFYADGRKYYVCASNNGYSGDLEIALVPDSFHKDILKMKEDSEKKILSEYSDVETVPFALLFQFDGDVKGTRHVLYNCTATRPQISGKTNDGKKAPQTETLTLDAAPMEDGLVRSRTTEETGESDYNGWFQQVWTPTEAAG